MLSKIHGIFSYRIKYAYVDHIIYIVCTVVIYDILMFNLSVPISVNTVGSCLSLRYFVGSSGGRIPRVPLVQFPPGRLIVSIRYVQQCPASGVLPSFSSGVISPL